MNRPKLNMDNNPDYLELTEQLQTDKALIEKLKEENEELKDIVSMLKIKCIRRSKSLKQANEDADNGWKYADHEYTCRTYTDYSRLYTDGKYPVCDCGYLKKKKAHEERIGK